MRVWFSLVPRRWGCGHILARTPDRNFHDKPVDFGRRSKGSFGVLFGGPKGAHISQPQDAKIFLGAVA